MFKQNCPRSLPTVPLIVTTTTKTNTVSSENSTDATYLITAIDSNLTDTFFVTNLTTTGLFISSTTEIHAPVIKDNFSYSKVSFILALILSVLAAFLFSLLLIMFYKVFNKPVDSKLIENDFIGVSEYI